MRTLKKSFRKFTQLFFHPRIFIYILAGTLIIFLTFLTNDNALEIAISGIASVFIGIGVNNYSTLETTQRDGKKMKNKTLHSLEALELVNTKIRYIQRQTEAGKCSGEELDELCRFVSLMIQLIKEDAL